MSQMKMTIDPLTKSYHGYNLKGSRALELIMDNKTPKVDLLVRESIQNSTDATLKSKDSCLIKFDTKTFSNSRFSNFIDGYGNRLIERFGKEINKALIISDYNTSGLLGEAYETPNKPNNLYKLVYAFLESEKGENSGGSWGIGKSVYFRYGKGIVFYYTSTFEDGIKKHKLVGALLEDEQKESRIIDDVDKYLGVAFIGKQGLSEDGEKRSLPITEVDFIKEFLKTFNLDLYSENQTGTKIIIPYFDENALLKDKINDEEAPWDDTFEDTLCYAIQRRYFPRINNYEVGKYIEVYINGNKVELIPFFDVLQRLYNGKLEGADAYKITANNFDANKNVLGIFRYKKFTKEELDVLTRPNNYPDPYCILDIKEEGDINSNEAIIFYTRNPRMIVTYDDSRKFTNLKTGAGEYIIGIFILNDRAEHHGDKLGEYFKESETANHKGREDIKESKKAPHISSLKVKPFRNIIKSIARELNEKYSILIPNEVQSINTKLQKDLGSLLLPPEDFGNEPTPPRRNKKERKDPLSNLKRESQTKIFDTGFIEGRPTYTVQVLLKQNQQYILKTVVQTSNKKYTLDERDKMDFELPCYLKIIEIDKYYAYKAEFNFYAKRDFDELLINRNLIKKDGVGDEIFRIEMLETSNSRKVYGFKLINKTNEDFKINLDLSFEPEDETSCFGLVQNISKAAGSNNGE